MTEQGRRLFLWDHLHYESCSVYNLSCTTRLRVEIMIWLCFCCCSPIYFVSLLLFGAVSLSFKIFCHRRHFLKSQCYNSPAIVRCNTGIFFAFFLKSSSLQDRGKGSSMFECFTSTGSILNANDKGENTKPGVCCFQVSWVFYIECSPFPVA